MDTPDLSLSDNIDSTDDLVPSLQVRNESFKYIYMLFKWLKKQFNIWL